MVNKDNETRAFWNMVTAASGTHATWETNFSASDDNDANKKLNRFVQINKDFDILSENQIKITKNYEGSYKFEISDITPEQRKKGYAIESYLSEYDKFSPEQKKEISKKLTQIEKNYNDYPTLEYKTSGKSDSQTNYEKRTADLYTDDKPVILDVKNEHETSVHNKLTENNIIRKPNELQDTRAFHALFAEAVGNMPSYNHTLTFNAKSTGSDPQRNAEEALSKFINMNEKYGILSKDQISMEQVAPGTYKIFLTNVTKRQEDRAQDLTDILNKNKLENQARPLHLVELKANGLNGQLPDYAVNELNSQLNKIAKPDTNLQKFNHKSFVTEPTKAK